ncbi:MAG: HlyD family efflux transporter periplasmic adaptor subunit [Rickettsiales bacterium]|nr:HlyD family efflux transporter periplasmic adaptor subunit [Rickettsiales bacterium]
MMTEFSQHHKQRLNTLHQMRIPRVMQSVARLVRVMILTIIIFLVFTPWVQTAPGSGHVTAFSPGDRLQTVNAQVSGRISRWFVQDGVQVKEGDPIVEIIDNDPRLVERLRAERDAVIRKFEAAQIAVETAEINLNRQEDLYKRGLSARKEFEEARIKYKTLKSAAAQASADVNKADVQLSRQASQLITAPRDGTVVQILSGNLATFIKEGDQLATFLPNDSRLAVELYVNGLDIPLIRAGRHVRLQFEGWPVVQFSGWPSVAIGTFAGIVTVVEPNVSPNGRFRLLITEDPAQPWPSRHFLRFGAKVKGWVLLNKVPLGYAFFAGGAAILH